MANLPHYLDIPEKSFLKEAREYAKNLTTRKITLSTADCFVAYVAIQNIKNAKFWCEQNHLIAQQMFEEGIQEGLYKIVKNCRFDLLTSKIQLENIERLEKYLKSYFENELSSSSKSKKLLICERINGIRTDRYIIKEFDLPNNAFNKIYEKTKRIIIQKHIILIGFLELSSNIKLNIDIRKKIIKLIIDYKF